MALLNWLKGGSSNSSIFGKKPKYGTTEAAAAEATRANLANLPEAQKLAGQVNTFNAGEMSRLMEMTQPGFGGRQKKIGDIYDARLAGQFTPEELNQQQLDVASRNVSQGTAGSPAHYADLARTFGFNRYKATQETIDSFSRWTQSVAQLTQPAAFNVASAFVPFDVQLGWNKQIAEGEAAPDPVDRGMFDSRASLFGMVTSGYAGGAGYTNSYRPASQQPSGGAYPQYNNMANPNIYPQYSTVSGTLAPSSAGYGSGGPYE